MIWYAVKAAPAVYRKYKRRLGNYPVVPRSLPQGFGLGTASEPRLLERMHQEIPELKADCVLVRVAVWDLDNLGRCRDFLLEMERSGINTVVAVLQDRRSVIDEPYWQEAIERIFGELGGVSSYFEIGHAWNRMKWGVSSFEQYLDLFEAAGEKAASCPGVKLVGPAVIDFEYLCTMGSVFHPVRAPRFDALSSLLYVDRRGAPENRQHGFDLVRKAIFMKAITDASHGEGTPFWITETNWPLAVPGEYSPTSMTESVDPEKYADYMTRYFLLSITTGAVDRIFWWQVAAHGYGMIDDIDGKWERRPAWHAFRTMTSILSGATLVEMGSEPGVRELTFETGDRQKVTVSWSTNRAVERKPLFTVSGIMNRDGKSLPIPRSGTVLLGPSPIYIFHRT